MFFKLSLGNLHNDQDFIIDISNLPRITHMSTGTVSDESFFIYSQQKQPKKAPWKTIEQIWYWYLPFLELSEKDILRAKAPN
jgi:hypothetical protein